MMSSRTRSNGSARIFSTARRPFSAVSTECPCCFRRRERRSRFISTSSTTRSLPGLSPADIRFDDGGRESRDRSRKPAASSTISHVSGGGEQASQERQLLHGGFLPPLDHVRVKRRVAQPDVTVEGRDDRKDHGRVGYVVEE